MQAQEVRSIVEQAANAWIQADIESFSSLFTYDGEFIVPGVRLVGQAAIRQSMTSFVATSSDVSIKISQILVACPSFHDSEADRAMVEWHWEDTEIATGYRHRADDAIAIDFQGRRISRWREYIDAK